MTVRIIKDTKANMVTSSTDPTAPKVLYEDWAEVIECGCKVVFGQRMDNAAPATVSCPCPLPAHVARLAGPFHEKLVASISDPTHGDRQTIDVLKDLLEELYVDKPPNPEVSI